MKKLILLLSTFIFIVFGSNFANADHYEDEETFLYFQNINTNEIKELYTVNGSNNNYFDKIIISKIENIDFPKKNYFKNWNLIGYKLQSRDDFIDCVLNENGESLKKKFEKIHTNYINNKCLNIGEYSSLKIDDISFFDKIIYYIDIFNNELPFFIFGLIFNFFILFPIAFFLHYLTHKKINRINIIYFGLFLYCLYFIIKIINGNSATINSDSSINAGFSFIFDLIIKFPFFVFGIYIFFYKYINKGITLWGPLIFIFWPIITISTVGLTISGSYNLLFIFCFFTILYLIKRKKIEQYLETKLMKCTH